MVKPSKVRDSGPIRPSDRAALPELLRPFFWDCDFSRLDWKNDTDFIVSRVLSHGTWEAIAWVRKAIGDAPLRDWLLANRARGLSPGQLRFWELILDLPGETVNAWMNDPGRSLWDRRAAV